MSRVLSAQMRRLTPEQAVAFVRRLGPTATKIGQYLALRPDLIPKEYADEFLKLVDQVPPFSWEEASNVLRSELRRDPASLFPYIERRPVAAGSLAQVHRARLDDGTEVAVKIQRPGIEATIARDVRRMKRLGRLLERRGGEKIASPAELADEVERWLMEEIDFTRELENVQRLRELAAKSPIQYIPRAYPRLSTRRVLTYEFVDGIPASSALAEIRDGLRHAERVVGGMDYETFAENLITACLTQIFRYRFFHTDLHPGNLMILDDNVVGFVDFGLCDELDDTVRRNQLRYLSAVYNNDVQGMYRALTEILITTDRSDMEGFRRDFIAETRSLEGRELSDRRSEGETPTSHYLNGLVRAARRNGLRIPTRILSIYRALLTAETLANQFGYADGLRTAGQVFFRELQRDELLTSFFDNDNIKQFLASVLNVTRDAPGQINQILTDVADGSLNLSVEVSETPKVTRSRNLRAKLWTVAMIAIAVSLLLTRPALPRLFGIPLEWPLTASLVVLYLWVAVLWRKL